MNKKAKRTPAKKVTELVKKSAGLPERASAGVAAVASADPMDLLRHAIDANLPVESMERLLAMRKEMKQEWAREQFFHALAGFQNECPTIEKLKNVKGKSKDGAEGKKKYSYAPIEDIVEKVRPYLEKWGFSFTFKGKQDNGTYTAICVAHHKDGHSEETQFTVPTVFPEYMNMSGPQMQGAACTYADRYAFKNAFGIVTKGDDTDAVQEEGDQGRKPLKTPQEKPAEKAELKPHEEKELTDYEKVQRYMQAVEVDPKSKLRVRLFSENEEIDYLHEAKDAKPEDMKKILDDIVQTGTKRRKAIRGE
jgi:hypothetical protein